MSDETEESVASLLDAQVRRLVAVSPAEQWPQVHAQSQAPAGAGGRIRLLLGVSGDLASTWRPPLWPHP